MTVNAAVAAAAASTAVTANDLPPPLTGEALEEHAARAWQFYRETLGSPKHVCAPMVDQSELPFRLLCRRYGTHLCYTPMVHARCFLEERRPNRTEMYYCNTTPDDTPTIAQMCGNDPAILLGAAHELAKLPGIVAVDLNLGCPQGIARRGHYGAFLLEETERLVRIVWTLARGPDAVPCPVTCKVRILPTMEATMKLSHALVGAGCSVLTVHGRTRAQNKQTVGTCDWGAIKAIREALPIPVFANGGVADQGDVERCLAETGVAAVMSSEALLENPGLFSRNVDSVTGRVASQDDLAEQYMELAAQFPPFKLKVVRAHIFKILFTGLQRHTDLRDRLVAAKKMQGMWEVVREMKRRREAQPDPALMALSWYYRWWPGRGSGGGFRLEEEDEEEGEEGNWGGVEGRGALDLMACDDDAMGCLFGGDGEEE